MKKTLFLWILFGQFSIAQSVYKSKESNIEFHAGTSVEDIDAENTKAISFINLDNGEVVIAVPNKDFIFKRSLMQEHFNENYMESEKYPKIEFKGILKNIEALKSESVEKMDMECEGNLSMHGVTKKVILPVKVSKVNNKIVGESSFKIKFVEYNIQRPQILWEKLAEEVEVKSVFKYEVYKK